ncbi:MAG TPA: 4-hydroxythreonine-4-phosphate dehydrogenase PdxA [Verrucomicrobiae bacterium]|nr:4-hydroxythreonine-4-phosphate dehydrogenase PdxA [Verrucomicrobiae bacterium]
MSARPILGLTMGDPAGVGPELCARALREPSVLRACVPVLFGGAGVIKRLAQAGLPVPGCRTVSLAEWEKGGTIGEPLIVDCAAMDAASFRVGAISPACGKAAFAWIEQAIRAAMAGRIAGVVTAPVHKEALRLAGVPYPGHTEIFTALTGAKRSCMMLRSDVLTVSMVTTHVGYAEVPRKLSTERILDVIELTDEAMRRMLGRAPRLAVCGLNPHAGEHGLFGQHEEEQIIQPAVQRANGNGIAAEGPLPPDAAFTPSQRKRFDAIVTMYHDQGHIPFKMLAFDTGVNVTLGLPIVRTSVDHGTAFDIAWKGVADPRSLYAAIRVAVDLASGQQGRAESA